MSDYQSLEQKEQDDNEHQWNLHMLSGTLDSDHVHTPPNTFTHLTMWLHNSEAKEQERRKQQESGVNSGSGGGGAAVLFLLGCAPLVLYLLYRAKRWGHLALASGVLGYAGYQAFHVYQVGLLGSLASMEMAFLLIYLPVGGYIALNQWISYKVAKGAPFRITLTSAVSWVTWLFLIWQLYEQGVWSLHWIHSYRMIQWDEYWFNGRYSHSPHFSNYEEYARYGLALIPTIPTMVLLQAWFRRRLQQGKRSVPLLLSVPTWLLATTSTSFFLLVYWSTHAGR
jgi:hypothetical protein